VIHQEHEQQLYSDEFKHEFTWNANMQNTVTLVINKRGQRCVGSDILNKYIIYTALTIIFRWFFFKWFWFEKILTKHFYMLILKIKKSDKNYFDSFKIIKLFTKYMDEHVFHIIGVTRLELMSLGRDNKFIMFLMIIFLMKNSNLYFFSHIKTKYFTIIFF
jgi:hypothetical protein